MISYDEAVREMEDIKYEYKLLGIDVQTYYLDPKIMTKIPRRINDLVKRENILVDKIIEAYPQENEEKIKLREKRKEVHAEYAKSQQITIDVEKKLLGLKKDLEAKEVK